jgi:hypothetical protein
MNGRLVREEVFAGTDGNVLRQPESRATKMRLNERSFHAPDISTAATQSGTAKF